MLLAVGDAEEVVTLVGEGLFRAKSEGIAVVGGAVGADVISKGKRAKRANLDNMSRVEVENVKVVDSFYDAEESGGGGEGCDQALASPRDVVLI
jgi:hypothetical protein